jgi:hypothetical protein
MAILTKHFNVQAANLAVYDMVLDNAPKYLFVSRPLPWTDEDGNWNDLFVPNADHSFAQFDTSVYNDIVFGKLITSSDCIQMVPRYDWVPGQVYAKFSTDDANLFSKNFYVVTDDRNVYKCVDNNYEVNSTVKPTVTSTRGIFHTGDGYAWKYMYTIPADTDDKFSTSNFIPVVANNSVKANAVPGTVDSVSLSSLGNNYNAYYSGYLKNAVNGYVVVLDSNASPYSNFYVGSSMYLKSGLGSGQIREIVAYDGLNKFVRLDTPFDTYATLSLSGITGTLDVGDTLTQNLDALAIVYKQGVFQVGDTVVQSDTGVNGTIASANSTVLQVVRGGSTVFDVKYPIYNTTSAGSAQPGTVSVQPFTQLLALSNTAAFTIGETIYQSNGSANVGNGVLFAVTALPSINASFEPVGSVNTANKFISLSQNPYSVGQQLRYRVDDGNTAVFPLANNTSYYVSYSNGSGIKLATTPGGADITLAVTKQETFNSNTGINGNSFISSAGNWFTDGQIVVYTCATGNTIPTGLTNGFAYFVTHANSSGLNLSLTSGGPNVEIQATTVSETGHRLTFYIPPEIGHSLSFTQQQLSIVKTQGSYTNAYQVKGSISNANAILQSAYSDANGLSYIYSTDTGTTTFVASFPEGSYIRVGANTSSGIRRVLSVNASCVVVDEPLSQSAIANTSYLIPNATEFVSYTLLTSNGLITNTNINSSIVNYANAAKFGTLFIPGERIDLVDSSLLYQGTRGTVSFSNTTSVVISDIVGPGFLPGFYIFGESSTQSAYINDIAAYPTITVKNPLGQFVIGQSVFARSTSDLSILHGSANVIAYFITPGQLTEYIISPTVSITGDGEGALAYSTVNTSPYVNMPIANVVVINTGTGYTYANATITSNLSHGRGASAIPAVSPLLGHGYDVYEELGANFLGISLGIANSMFESYKFPIFGDYRKVGIIDTPMFNDLYVNIDSYDRVKLSIRNASNTYFPGECVYQPGSNAAGVVVYANDTYLELKNVMGVFSANGKFANSLSTNDNVVGLYSTSIANVNAQEVATFSVLSNSEFVYEVNTRVKSVLVSVLNDSNIQLTNVEGLFSINDTLYDPSTNTYAWVNAIYTSNGTVNASENFGLRFNQTLRIPLTTNTEPYQLYEEVTQDVTGASGVVVGGAVMIPISISTNVGNDVDLTYSGAVGSFPVGSIVYNTGNAGVGIVISSNSSYLRLSAVVGTFVETDSLTSTINATATVDAVYPVMILNNVDGNWSSGVLSGNIHGSNTGAVGRCDLSGVFVYPDLVRNSGKVMYLENLAPFTLSNTSQENFNVVIQF